MEPDATQLHLAMRDFLERHKLKVTTLEVASGVGSGTIRKYLDNPVAFFSEPNYAKVAAGASALLNRSVTVAELRGATNADSTPTDDASQSQSDHNLFIRTNVVVTSLPPLIVFRAVAGLGVGGSTLIFKEKVGELVRIDQFKFARDAFCIQATDDLMRPSFRARATIVIDPAKQWVVDDDCLFVRDPDADPLDAVARCLVKVTPSAWVVMHHTSPGEKYELLRSDYPKAWPIIGILRV